MIRNHFPPTTPSMASDPALVAGEGGGNIRAWLISGMWWRPRHAIRSVTFIVDARWWRIMNEHHLVGAGLYLFSFFMPKDKYSQYTSQGTPSIGPKAHTQCQDKVLISRTFPMKKSISESAQNFCNHINNQQSARLNLKIRCCPVFIIDCQVLLSAQHLLMKQSYFRIYWNMC